MSLLDGLERFEKASPQLLEQRSLLRRTDSKFLLTETQVAGMLAGIGEDYAVLYSAGEPIANYRTLYFDTDDLRCYHDHRRGRRLRHKIRVRHYVERQVSFLEVKTKRNELLTVKERVKRTYNDDKITGKDRHFVSSHCTVPADELVPQVWTNFRRITLLGIRSSERVTIDTNLTIQRGEMQQALRGLAIVELKQAPFCVRTPAMRALRSAGIRPTSASKYCIATAMSHQDLRLSRLRPMLKQVKGMTQ
jgi:hypothetical protein